MIPIFVAVPWIMTLCAVFFYVGWLSGTRAGEKLGRMEGETYIRWFRDVASSPTLARNTLDGYYVVTTKDSTYKIPVEEKHP